MKQLLFLISITLLFLITPFITDGQNNTYAIQRADSLVQVHQQNQGPGLAITVKQNGQALYKQQQGFANLEHRIPISDSTVFLD